MFRLNTPDGLQSSDADDCSRRDFGALLTGTASFIAVTAAMTFFTGNNLLQGGVALAASSAMAARNKNHRAVRFIGVGFALLGYGGLLASSNSIKLPFAFIEPNAPQRAVRNEDRPVKLKTPDYGLMPRPRHAQNTKAPAVRIVPASKPVRLRPASPQEVRRILSLSPAS